MNPQYSTTVDADNTAEYIRSVVRLLHSDGDVVELRAFGERKTLAGFFDDFDKLSEEAAEADCRGFDVYMTVNPCKDALLGRIDNELRKIDPKETPLASDKDIERRSNIFIDCDPERPAKLSSSEREKELALDQSKEIGAWLAERGIPFLRLDSGNGAHLLIPVDLPNNDESTKLVEGFLKAISFKFSDDKVKVDTSTYNAARITKAYGVVARKRENLERKGRVHRRSKLLKTLIPGWLQTARALKPLLGSNPQAHRAIRG